MGLIQILADEGNHIKFRSPPSAVVVYVGQKMIEGVPKTLCKLMILINWQMQLRIKFKAMNKTSFQIKKFLIVLVLSLFSNICFAQELLFDNVRTTNLVNQCVLKANDSIKGYLFIYERDIIDDNEDTHSMTITDDKLIVKSSVDIKIPNESSILESSFNGSEILLSFLHPKSKSLECQVYSKDGIKRFSYFRDLGRKEFKDYNNIALGGVDNNPLKTFSAVEEIGFISKTDYKEKSSSSISINFYGTKENNHWTYTPLEGASYFYGEYLGIYKNIVYINLFTYKSSLYTDKPSVFLVGLDLNTGKELFKRPASGKFKIIAKGLKVSNKGTCYLYGSYYSLNADLKQDKPDGFALWQINDSGDVLDEKYNSWSSDLNNFLKISDKGKIEGTGYLHLQNLVQTANGDTYVLAEGYDKRLNAATVIQTALFGLVSVMGQSFFKEVSTDVLLIKMDSDFKIKEVTLFDKSDSRFIYHDNQVENGKLTSVDFWYFSYKKNILNAIRITPEKIDTEKINLNFKTNKSRVLPSVKGEILLIDYFAASKKIAINKHKGFAN